MLKELIIIEGDVDYQCDEISDIVKKMIDNNYYSFNDKEKKNKLKMLAMANCIGEKVEILDEITYEDSLNLDGKFIIIDEITYILSLLMINKIVLLERVDANKFAKALDKSQIKDNYIIINKFAKELLLKYLKERVG